MVTTKLNLSMTEPSVRQIYAKQGDTGRVLDITLDQTPEDGTLRILRTDGVEVTSEAVTGGEVESGSSFESLTEADVTELTVGIEPVQDLNGYDKPWVGGAGKNKLNNRATTTTHRGVTFTVNSDGTVTASGTASGGDASIDIRVDTSSVYGDFYFNALYGYTSDTSFYAYMWDVTTGGRCKQWNGTTNSLSSYNGTLRQVKIVQGNAVYMTCRVRNGVTVNNVVAYPMIVASTVTDNTWQPYSNICPITGHDEVRVFDTAEQMYDPSQVVIGRNWTGGSADNRAVFEFVPTPNVSYEIVTVGGNFSDILFIQMNGGAQLSNTGILPSNTPMTITIAENCNRVIIQFNKNSAITTSDFLDFECSVSTKTTTYTTSLGQTVYGGTLDMVTGQLVVDKAMVDLGALSWSKGNRNTADTGYVFFSTSIASTISRDVTAEAFCSAYAQQLPRKTAWESLDNGRFQVEPSGYLVFVADYSDAPTFKTALSGVQLVYKLATPVEYQLTPQQIKTLVGTNNVWASSGDIVSIKFTYGGLLSELPSDATSVVGKCYCDVEQNGVSSMPFTLNVKKNERAT